MGKSDQKADWIGLDWGTDSLRGWMMDASGQCIAQATSDQGVERLEQDQFEPALLDLIDAYLDGGRVTPVLCAGMIGGRQGWCEAGFQTAPCQPAQFKAASVVLPQDPRISVHVLPGISQSKPPDVMRGEEILIAGVLLDDPEFDGVLCLPGQHTKWVRVSAGEIVSFQTVMTQELISLLSAHSDLRHSLQGQGWDHDGFLSGLRDGMDRPQAVTAALFGVRAADLIDGTKPDTARARLAGLLVGLELAATKPYWLGQHVAIVGDSEISGHYSAGLAEQGVPAQVIAGPDELMLKGLVLTHRGMQTAT